MKNSDNKTSLFFRSIACALMIMICTVPIILFALEIGPISIRGLEGTSYEFSTRQSINFDQWPTLIYPFFHGGKNAVHEINMTHLETGFFGKIPFIILLLSLFSLKKISSYNKMLLLCIFIVFFIGLGKYNPFYPYLFKYILGFAQFRCPGRIFIHLPFFGLLAAGLFIHENRDQSSYKLKIFSVLLFIFTCGHFGILRYFIHRFHTDLSNIIIKYSSFLSMHITHVQLEKLSVLLKRFSNIPFSHSFFLIQESIFICSFAAVFLFVFKKKFKLFLYLFLIFSVADIIHVYTSWYTKPVQLRSDSNNSRIRSIPLNNGNSVILSHFIEFINLIEKRPRPYELSYNTSVSITKKSPLLNFLDIEYIYNKKNNDNLGKCWIAEKIIPCATKEQILTTLSNYSEGAVAVILQNDAKKLSVSNEISEIRSLQYTGNSIKYAIKTSCEQLVVFSEIFYPYWNAWIDQKPTKIIRVNHIFRGVYVPAGEHIVTMKFQPIHIAFSILISYYSLLICMCIGAFFYKKQYITL